MLQLSKLSVGNVLRDLSLTIKKEEFVLIVGDNGSGKTTLFNAISGYIKPTSGSIILDGEDVTDMPQHARAFAIANVFQDPKSGTIGNMTLRENLNIAYMRCSRRSFRLSNSRTRDDLYCEKLNALGMGLENRLDEKVRHLSGGQRQALSLIMSTISNSKLLLLDEVTAALDTKASKNILNIVHEITRREKKTCLMITHDISHAESWRDKLFVLKNGKLHNHINYCT
ncbi:MAG: ATP-binding cassette domain-containing protein [Holosporaceae bacterium]|jgi:putative ABC transport system ATP-binding protein|nr:ATP-binding cassette domain-containing protein [Holosporaceae bacterium]